MKEIGEVIAGGRTATVRISRKAECEGCKMCSFRRGENYVKVRAENAAGAVAGDTVEVVAEKSFTLQASLIVYILPLLIAAAGLVGGYFLGGEILAFGLCLGCLLLGYIIVATIDRALSKRRGYAPRIAKILPGTVKQSEATEHGKNSATEREQL